MPEDTEDTHYCIKCNRETPNGHWLYLWKGKQGFTCDDCGKEIHAIGYYLLDKASDLYDKHHIAMGAIKEKFGRFEIYAYPETEEQTRIVKATQEFYEKQYPEFTWELDS